MTFPDGFLWGTAACAYQTEGGNVWSDWHHFERADLQSAPAQRRFVDLCGAATEFWTRYEEDLDLAVALGATAHRLSVEWGRVEPEPGRYDRAALAHYRRILEAMRARGLRVMLTAQHFTVPTWTVPFGPFQDAPAVVEPFRHYVGLLADELGDLVDSWVPVNEPTMVTLTGHYVGVHPPFEASPAKAVRAYRTLVKMHAAGYHALKARDPRARVGCAHAWLGIEPWDARSAVDRAAASFFQRSINDSFFEATATGRLPLHLGGPIPEAAGTLDWVGLNYYTRFMTRGAETVGTRPGDRITDMGWSWHPEGLHKALHWLHRHVGKPIYITENGIATLDEADRIAFLRAYLTQIGRAAEEGVDVRGYLHWCLTDNWEWVHGRAPRFGLVAVDYETQERTVKDGGRWYAEVARRNALPDPSEDAGFVQAAPPSGDAADRPALGNGRGGAGSGRVGGDARTPARP